MTSYQLQHSDFSWWVWCEGLGWPGGVQHAWLIFTDEVKGDDEKDNLQLLSVRSSTEVKLGLFGGVGRGPAFRSSTGQALMWAILF